MAQSSPTIGQAFGVNRINTRQLGPGPKLVFINRLGKPVFVFMEPMALELAESLPHEAKITVEFIGAKEILPCIEVDQSVLTIYDESSVITDDYAWEISMPADAAGALD